jgi:hypothetical protein
MGVPTDYFEDNMIVIRERFRQAESELRSHVYSNLKDMSAVERTVALEELRATLSPYIAITAPEVWGQWEMYVPTHVTASYEAAVNNIVKATGQVLSPEEEKYLRIILTHNSGWGATYPEHMDDPWVTYVNTDRHVKGLIPILDSMTYPEELEHLWPRRLIKMPSLFLLFSEGSFYVLCCWIDQYPTLYKAGKCLKEVYVGLKNHWHDENCEGGRWLPEITTDEMYPAGCFLHSVLTAMVTVSCWICTTDF